MIPKFPEFKKLELTDKEDVEKFTSKFPHYSDFNFINMWIWNIYNEMETSQLNNNLVVVFSDYISGKPFLSFIGENKISETASELIKFSEKRYKTSLLKLIPEEMASVLGKSGYNIVSDTDSHDYVYLVSHMANMDKWSKNSSGKKIRQFIKKRSSYTVKTSSIQEISQEEHKEMFQRWAKNKDIINPLELNEYKAFEKLLQIKDKNIKIVSLYIKNVLAGFTVYEILPNNYAISHFAKADIELDSAVYSILNWEEAKILKDQGIKYYNWEQDLGIQGLRNSKIKYKPNFFFKQYIISNSTYQKAQSLLVNIKSK